MVEKDDDAGARLLANKKLAGARLQFTPLSTLYQARDRGMWWRGSGGKGNVGWRSTVLTVNLRAWRLLCWCFQGISFGSLKIYDFKISVVYQYCRYKGSLMLAWTQKVWRRNR